MASPNARRSFHARLACISVLCAASSLGCKSPEERSVVLLEEMADVFSEHEADCDKLAGDLDALVKSNDEAMKAFADSDRSPESRAKLDKTYRKRIDAAIDKMIDKSGKCGKDPRVAEILGKIL